MSLIVDLLAMDAARIDIVRVSGEFSQATDRSERLADSVGHPGLAERVQNFASNWDQRRKELGQQLDTVAAHLDTAVKGFTETDESLAKALTAQETDYPPRTAVPV